MVKEVRSMLSHLNLIALNNYPSKSPTETIANSNMTISKNGSRFSSRSCSLINNIPNGDQHAFLHQQRNGYHFNRFSNISSISSIYKVYSNNLLEGSRLIRHLAKSSDIVAIDTEFPGVVCRINGEYSSTTTLSYHNIKCNTDLMKPIQIGFSFFNRNGEQSEINSTVQFNLKWDMETEVFAEDSIMLLENCGIDFSEHKRHGIEIQDFAEVFLTSGLPLNDKITWIGFHCAYDWAYMIKICTNMPDMPSTYDEFNELLLLYFPKTIDIKTIMTDKNLPKSGLQDLARIVNVDRVGAQHQAGSDAKLTGDTFFSFVKIYCNGVIDEKYINEIYGLNYCSTGDTNNVWLPNQSLSPDDDIGHQDLSVTYTHNLKHCHSLNIVSSVNQDQEQSTIAVSRDYDPNLVIINQSPVGNKGVTSNCSNVDSEGRSSRQSLTQSLNDSLDDT